VWRQEVRFRRESTISTRWAENARRAEGRRRRRPREGGREGGGEEEEGREDGGRSLVAREEGREQGEAWQRAAKSEEAR
jgi:hypothetical protein